MRSLAISDSIFKQRIGVRILTADLALSLAQTLSPEGSEGAGNAGCQAHPQPRVQRWKAHELVTTGSPKHSGIPCAMVLAAYSTLSPAIGLFCHRPRCDAQHRHQVDASVEASGPHGLAVHDKRIRLLRRRVHRIPHPTSVTIAKRPSDGCGTREEEPLICPSVKAKYFSVKDWTANANRPGRLSSEAHSGASRSAHAISKSVCSSQPQAAAHAGILPRT